MSYPTKLLASTFRRALLAATTDCSRVNLHAVRIETDTYAMQLVSTDGHRLHVITCTEFASYPLPTTHEIPRDALDAYLAIAGKHAYTWWGNGQFRVGSVEIGYSRKSWEKFPPYHAVLDPVLSRTPDHTLECNSRDLRRSVKDAIVEIAGVPRVVITPSGVARGDTTTPGLAVNPNYLLDAVKAAKAPSVRLSWMADEHEPLLVQAEVFNGVIMPMRAWSAE